HFYEVLARYLASAVRTQAWHRIPRGAGPDVDDPPIIDDVLTCTLKREERALGIDREHAIEGFFAHPRDQWVVGQLNTAVRDSDVESAELVYGGGEEVFNVGDLRDIGPDRDGLASCSFNCGNRIERGVLVAREVHNHAGPERTVSLGDRLADPARRTG